MEKVKTYHTIQINPELLKIDRPTVEQLSPFVTGRTTDILPKGKLIGLYFNSYVKELDAWSAIDYQAKEIIPIPGDQKDDGVQMALPQGIAMICSHTPIRIEDTRNRLVTEPVDLRDYQRKNWGSKGFKDVFLDLKENEQITIAWEVIGDDFPPCGEFVFVIEEENTCNV